MSVPGQVYHGSEKEHGQASQSITIRTSAEQDRAMQAVITARIQNPGLYNFYHRNCAQFVRDVLKAGNLPAPDYAEPNPAFSELRMFYPNNPVTRSPLPH
jgi:hypothetical protein